MVARWEVHPRDADLGRTHDPVRWESLDLIERLNVGATWKVTGPTSSLGVFEAGMGCILDRDGDQIESGQVTSLRRVMSTDEDTGRTTDTMEVGFASDLGLIGGRIVFPDPAHTLSPTPSQFAVSHDARSGPTETVLLAYLAAHIGSMARIDRRLASLVLPMSLGRGGTTSVQARFDNLGVLVQSLADAGNLRVRVRHDESTGTPRLRLTINEVQDLSAAVRFGLPGSTAMGVVTGFDYRISAPTTTRAIVASAGELEDRSALQVIDAGAESLWGVVAERLVDQRQTDDVADLLRAGHEALEQGASPVEITVDVADGMDVSYRHEYWVGSRVGFDLPGIPDALVDTVIREARTQVGADGRERVQITAGSAGASGVQTKASREIARALRRVTALERS